MPAIVILMIDSFLLGESGEGCLLCEQEDWVLY